jgi:ribonucleases P/MRP protein subunit RPP40
MKFNVGKCQVMHIGANHQGAKYKMENVNIEESAEEKVCGAIIDDKFKVGKQCAKAASEGNLVLRLINRTFIYKDKSIMLGLYKALVRPHFEYCIQAWRPHLVKDKEILEKVQRRATRMIVECRGKSYEDRLKLLGITSLESVM